MDIGMPSAACSLISFDYYVSIALKQKNLEYSNRKEMTKVIKIQTLKCVKKGLYYYYYYYYYYNFCVFFLAKEK